MISVPAEDIFKQANRSLSGILAILLGIFALILGSVNFLLKRTVIHPLRKMAKTAEAASMEDLKAEFEQKTEDEIGILAKAFNRMKASLEISLNMLNKRQGN